MRKTYGLIIFLLIASVFKVSALSSVTGTYMYLDFQRMPVTALGFNGNYYDPFVGWPNICFTGGTYIVQSTNDINGTTTGVSDRNAYSAAGSAGIYPNVYNLMPDGSLALTLNTPNPTSYGAPSTIAGPSTGLPYDNRYFIPVFTDDFNFIGNTNAINAGTNATLSATINNKTTFTGGVMFRVFDNNRFSPALYAFDALVTANTTTNVAFIVPNATAVRGIEVLFSGIVGDVDIKKISLFGITSAFSATNPGCILTASSTGVTFNNLSTGSITGYFWNFGPGAIPATTLTSSLTNPTVVFTSTGVKTISLSVSGMGGIVKTFSGVITISGPSIVGTVSSNTNLTCAGSTVSVSVAGVTGNIQWERSPDNTTYTSITGATIAGYSTALGTSMYYHALVTNGGCPTVTSASKYITINSVPGILFNYSDPICATNSTVSPNLILVPGGGVFSTSTGSNISVDPVFGTLSIVNTVQGNFVTKYVLSVPGCGNVTSTSGIFRINSIPGINYTYGTTPVCALNVSNTKTTTFTTIAGFAGAFSTTATGLTLTTLGGWNFTNTVQGVFFAQYNVSVPGCGMVSSAAGITINSIPGILFNYSAPICATNSTVSPNLILVPGGGVFSTSTGSNIIVDPVFGTLSIVNTVQGNFVTKYVLSVPGCGNVTSTSGIFRINSIPGINYTYGTTPVCALNVSNTKTTTFTTIAGFAGAFSTTATGLTLTTLGGWVFTNTVQGVFYGQYDVTVPGCGVISTTAGVTINSIPGITYNYNAPICATDGTAIPNLTVTSSMAGASFSIVVGSNISINTLTGLLSFANTVQGGAFNTRYTISVPGCGNVSSTTGVFRINSVPGLNYTYGATPVCALLVSNSKATTPAPFTVPGFAGTFSTTATGLTLTTAGGWNFTNTVQGIFYSQYDVTIPGCGVFSTTVGITINSVPGITYNYNAPLCATDGTALPNLTAPGGGFFSTVTGNNISLNSVTGILTFAGTVQGNYNTRYTVSISGCGNVSSTTGTFRINSIPGINYTYATSCALAVSNSRATTPTTFTIPGFAGSFSSTETALTFIPTSGGWNFTNTVQGVFYSKYDVTVPGCGIVSSTVGITINSIPGIAYNYGAPLCARDGMALPNLTAPGGGFYSTLTGSNISLNSISGILTFAGTVQGNYNTRYTISVPGCGNVSSTTGTFRINSVPGITYNYNNGNPVCATSGSRLPTMTNTLAGGTFSSIATELDINTLTGRFTFANTVQGVFTGQYNLSIAGCGIITSTAGITINSIPGVTFSYNSPVCSTDGSAAPIISNTVVGGYFTTAGVGLTVNSVTGVWGFVNTVQGSFLARYNAPVAGCGISPFDATITINSVQSVTYDYNSPVCATKGSEPAILSTTLAGGYFTTTATGLTLNSATGVWLFANTVQGSFVGEYNVLVPGCQLVTSIAGITINSLPGVNYIYNGPICATDLTVSPLITGTLPGGYFSGGDVAAGVNIDPNSGVLTFPKTTQGNFAGIYNISIPGCGIVPYYAGIKINAIPNLIFSYPSTICAADRYKEPDISSLLGGGYFTASPDIAVNSFTGTLYFPNTIQGNFISKYSLIVPGCGLISSSTGIAINSIPEIKFSYANPFCATDGSALPTITGSLPSGYFSTTATGLTLDANSGKWTFGPTVEGDFAGKYNYSIAGCGLVSSTAGITISQVLNASVDLLPVKDTICDGTNVLFTAVGINTGNDPKYIWKINSTAYTLQSPFFSSIVLKDKDVVSVTLQSSLKCIAQKADTSQAITFTVTPSKFDEFIVISGAKEVCEGDNFTYSITPVAGVEYSWTIPGEGSIVSGQGTNAISVLFNALPAKESYVSMMFKNQCTESALIKTEVIASTTCTPVFKITNLVTPNSGDGNSVWHIIGIEKYPDAEVKIYTSWGDLVFESKGYAKEWDGKYKGNSVSTATYYYSLDLKNGAKVKTGYITVRE